MQMALTLVLSLRERKGTNAQFLKEPRFSKCRSPELLAFLESRKGRMARGDVTRLQLADRAFVPSPAGREEGEGNSLDVFNV